MVPQSPDYLLRSPNSRETPFPQVLREYNGFEPGRPWMELHPGMELRVENAYYRPGMSRRGLDGYLGTEVARYKITANGGLELVSVQPMKDRPSEQLPVQGLIRPDAMKSRFHRFYFEILFRRSGATRGSVVLSADDQNEINRLGNELVNDPDSVCGAAAKNCTVFPEACSVSIEMEVVVNGAAKDVIWGTLLKSVAEGAEHLEVRRMYNGKLIPVKFGAQDATTLRMPLLPGDHLKFDKK